MNELIAAFAAWREEIDSVPFAHEQMWAQLVGDVRQESAP